MRDDLERGLKEARPAEGPEALRRKALSRAEKETLEPFALELRRFGIARPVSDLKGRVLAGAAREAAAIRRERFVRYAAVLLVALCAPVNLRVGAHQGDGRPAPPAAVPAPFITGGPVSETGPYRLPPGWRSRRLVSSWEWSSFLRERRALAWSEPRFKG